jgi:hypothetical protein
MEGGSHMTNERNQLTKGEVQTTTANKLPVPGENDTEFSAEEAAQVFKQNKSANRTTEDQTTVEDQE